MKRLIAFFTMMLLLISTVSAHGNSSTITYLKPELIEKNTSVSSDTQLINLVSDRSFLLNAAQTIVNSYNAYYYLTDIQVDGYPDNVEISKYNDSYIVDYYIKFTMQLRYKSAAELPHVQGMANFLGVEDSFSSTEELIAKFNDISVAERLENVISDITAATISETNQRVTHKNLLDSCNAANLVIDEAASFVEDIEKNYIGQASDTYIGIRLIVNLDGDITKTLYYNGGGSADGYTSDVSAVTPSSVEEMRKNGFRQIETMVISAKDRAMESVNDATVQEPYRQVTARDYANKWTSNATKICAIHGGKQDTSYYNKAYVSHCCNDCANYVSQAMFAGHIKSSDAWQPESRAWCGAISIRKYFLTATPNKWIESDATWCSAGGIIVLCDDAQGESPFHVMMCVHNDTVTRKQSSHTNDCKEVAYNVNSKFGSACVKYYMFEYKMTI